MKENDENLFLVRLSSLRVRTHSSGEEGHSKEVPKEGLETDPGPLSAEPILEEEDTARPGHAVTTEKSLVIGVPLENKESPKSEISNPLFWVTPAVEGSENYVSLRDVHQKNSPDSEHAEQDKHSVPRGSSQETLYVPSLPQSAHGMQGIELKTPMAPQTRMELHHQSAALPPPVHYAWRNDAWERFPPSEPNPKPGGSRPVSRSKTQAQTGRAISPDGQPVKRWTSLPASNLAGETAITAAETGRGSTRHKRSTNLPFVHEVTSPSDRLPLSSQDPDQAQEDETASLISSYQAEHEDRALQAKQQFTAFLRDFDPAISELRVISSHVMSLEQYVLQRCRRGLYNLQLRAKHASSKEVSGAPARIALADGMKQSEWISEHYDEIENKLMGLSWQTTLTIVLDLDVPQTFLDKVVTSLYTGLLSVCPHEIQAYLEVASFLQIRTVTECLLKYVQDVLIPANPSGCNLWAATLHPETPIQGMVLNYFLEMKWDGNTGATSLHHLASLLATMDPVKAAGVLNYMRHEPVILSVVECVKVCALLNGDERDVLLESLDCQELSMADVQGILHWASQRRSNRAVIANSSILWEMICSNSAILYAPLEALKRQIGPQAAHIKLWDLALLHIPPNPLDPSLPKTAQYTTRRSGWMHISGRAFCMEAVYSKRHSGWGLFCTVDRDHILESSLSIQLCVIWRDGAEVRAEMTPPLQAARDQGSGAGIGYRNLLSTWASIENLAWRKRGVDHLTIGLLIQESSEPLAPQSGVSPSEGTSLAFGGSPPPPERLPPRPAVISGSQAAPSDSAPTLGNRRGREEAMDELDLLEGGAESPKCRDPDNQIMMTTVSYRPNISEADKSSHSEGMGAYQCVYRNVSGREELMLYNQGTSADSYTRRAGIYRNRVYKSNEDTSNRAAKRTQKDSKPSMVEKLITCCGYPNKLGESIKDQLRGL